MATALHEQRCQACEGDIAALSEAEARPLLSQLAPHWQLLTTPPASLLARFSFRNYYQTTAFVNALAWIAHQENHHPDISFSYRNCEVRWTTHAAQGLSLNDFICAAKTDALLDRSNRDLT